MNFVTYMNTILSCIDENIMYFLFNPPDMQSKVRTGKTNTQRESSVKHPKLRLEQFITNLAGSQSGVKEWISYKFLFKFTPSLPTDH